jgi:hypothetical protein
MPTVSSIAVAVCALAAAATATATVAAAMHLQVAGVLPSAPPRGCTPITAGESKCNSKHPVSCCCKHSCKVKSTLLAEPDATLAFVYLPTSRCKQLHTATWLFIY